MRLIDADKLIEDIEKSRKENPHTDSKVASNHNLEHLHFIKLVNTQPTAYDVDKVVEHLEETREKDIPRINNTTTTRDEKVYKLAMSYAIDIVKAGGIDGN